MFLRLIAELSRFVVAFHRRRNVLVADAQLQGWSLARFGVNHFGGDDRFESARLSIAESHSTLLTRSLQDLAGFERGCAPVYLP